MTLPALEDQLTDERQHLDESRAALRRMRERAEALFATGESVAGDAYSAETLGRTLYRRVAALADDPNTALFFGRLDFAGRDPDAVGNERYHIGRRHVTDDAGEPMVLDWRAPISRAFYRASARDPQGVTVRRRFGFQSGALTSFEDEHLDRGEDLGTSSRILTTEIERPRVGPMRDIVATIQPEQDELVRAGIADSLCVQGAPGTGKTAVGLHRAAFLLYEYRERLKRNGVLIIGPNRAFLRYIAAVLPALGEVDVEQTTVDELVNRLPVRESDSSAAAAIKHDIRMAQVLARALRSRIGRPTGMLTVSDGSYRWRVREDMLRRIVDDVRREDLPYTLGRERVLARVVGLLQRQSEARRGDSPDDTWLRRMGRSAPVAELLDQVWPAVTPEGLVRELLTRPDILAAAAEGILTAEEQAAITTTARSVRAMRWTAADSVLIDEVAGLLDRPTGFGHVVVDEAQDLSPMQCRAVARRCEHGSVTLLGDLAQGTTPWAATDWTDVLTHLGKPDAPVVPLTMGFRVPAAVLVLANRLLPALDVDVSPAVSLRGDGALEIRQVSDLDGETVAEVRAALNHDGSVAVIAADVAVDRLAAALRRDGIVAGTPEDVEDAGRVTLVPSSLAKGLEFDHVIVVEPAEIVAAEERGLHRLYVVLTRAVSRLCVLHAAPLPPILR